VAKEFPSAQQSVITFMKTQYDASKTLPSQSEVVAYLLKNKICTSKRDQGELMTFATGIRVSAAERPAAL
jgi:hypothetical protein